MSRSQAALNTTMGAKRRSNINKRTCEVLCTIADCLIEVLPRHLLAALRTNDGGSMVLAACKACVRYIRQVDFGYDCEWFSERFNDLEHANATNVAGVLNSIHVQLQESALRSWGWDPQVCRLRCSEDWLVCQAVTDSLQREARTQRARPRLTPVQKRCRSTAARTADRTSSNRRLQSAKVGSRRAAVL